MNLPRILLFIAPPILALTISCGEYTAAESDPKNEAVHCDKCVAPPSRASFLLAASQDKKQQPVANPVPLTAETITKALNEKIIGPELALAEVRQFNLARIPAMPRPRTAEEWQAAAAKIRKDVLGKVVFRGSAAAWRNTPLKVEWGDTIDGLPGYRIRKVKFECLPGWWIPALLYEPLKLTGKVPVVLNVNGHARTGKATDYKQLRSINLAKRGMIVLNVEWIGMGQFANRMGHYQMNQLDLCGSSGIAPFYLNMSKGIDLLLEHQHADPKRVIVAGLSGGGWQTIFISALDPRVTLANPVAGYSSFITRAHHGSDLGDSEQTPNDLARFADYTHLTAMLADRSLLVTKNAKDNCCFAAAHALPPLKAAAEPVFALFNRQAHFRTHVNHDPGDHNFGLDNRQQLYRFIGDTFYKGDKNYIRDEIDSKDELKTYDELVVPLPKNNLSFNRIAQQLIKNFPQPQEGSKKARRAKLLKIIKAKNYTAKPKLIKPAGPIAHYQFLINKDWTLPGTVFLPANPYQIKGTTILISDQGRKTFTKEIQAALAKNHRVLAVDPFFFGESKIKSRDFLHVLLVHAVGERALGIQSSQLAALANWAKAEYKSPVTLHATGPRLTVAARLAAVQTDAIQKTELKDSLESLKDIIHLNKGANHWPELFCHGLLEHFDLKQIDALRK